MVYSNSLLKIYNSLLGAGEYSFHSMLSSANSSNTGCSTEGKRAITMREGKQNVGQAKNCGRVEHYSFSNCINLSITQYYVYVYCNNLLISVFYLFSSSICLQLFHCCLNYYYY